MPDATENQSKTAAKTLSRQERRRPGRIETVSPQILSLLRNPTGDGVVRKNGVPAKNLPADGIRRATPEGQIMDFLVRHKGRPYCDDCLKQQFRQVRAAQIAMVAKAIGSAVGFRQVTESCAGCRRVRAGIKAR